jgi:SAM-dependent methyltransferase
MKQLFRTFLFFLPTSVFEPFYFEFKSFLGRLFQGHLNLDKSKKNYINLGCGPMVKEGMINIDFFWEKNIDHGADLRFPLKIDNEAVDGIICEHTLEHLTYNSDEQLISECYRILKPGGVFRVILPDVSLFINAFSNENKAWFDEWEKLYLINSPDPIRAKRRLKSPLQAISFVTQEYGHISSWDVETLSVYLKNAGFKSIEKVEWRKGQISELLIDTEFPARRHVSMYVEAVK